MKTFKEWRANSVALVYFRSDAELAQMYGDYAAHEAAREMREAASLEVDDRSAEWPDPAATAIRALKLPGDE